MTWGAALRRGIWRAPYSYEGRPVFLIVDRRGDVRRQLVLKAGADEDRALAYLLDRLEQLDTEPVLRLVRPEPQPVRVARSYLVPDDATSRALRFAASCRKVRRLSPG